MNKLILFCALVASGCLDEAVEPGPIVGLPCGGPATCELGENSVCFSEAEFNAQDGYCTMYCANDMSICPSGSACIDHPVIQEFVCAATCESAADCRDGYACTDALGIGTAFCWPL